MSFFHNSTADLPHSAHHDGSQLLPCDDFHHMPGSNFDEDDIISVDLPDVNVVDTPVVRLKHGRPSSDIWGHRPQVHTAEELLPASSESMNYTEFAGAVTDNTSTNKKAWTLLREMFPSCYFQGCCSHGIHLLVKDIFAATKTKEG
ncbi:hypothetical protein BASA81_015546 [Batrachochytrium salamandrivorans]|nr:hypothetical protein BASA81_015546 [Batrachochytrium salamandrivorans]